MINSYGLPPPRRLRFPPGLYAKALKDKSCRLSSGDVLRLAEAGLGSPPRPSRSPRCATQTRRSLMPGLPPEGSGLGAAPLRAGGGGGGGARPVPAGGSMGTGELPPPAPAPRSGVRRGVCVCVCVVPALPPPPISVIGLKLLQLGKEGRS